MEWTRAEFILTDDPGRINLDRTFELLQATYWGVRRPREVVARMVEHSLCLVLLREEMQVGFSRAVTDYTVFSWIADLVVDPLHRGRGLGKWMMGRMREHPSIRDTQIVLQTRDAHSFYEKFGFAGSTALMSTAVVGL